MRTVISIPVIHTAADLGSLAESVRAHHAQCGPASWQERERLVAKLWDDIRAKLGAMALDHSRVRIYQDGLPVCGYELQIVRELAGAGSLNHQLILDLLGKGAILTGTEDPRLLISEYQLHRREIGMPNAHHGSGPSAGEAAALLEARDRFIAQRIAATLQEGETGLLFLGALHRLDALSASGIEVRPLG
jgi:hypothetical protein